MPKLSEGYGDFLKKIKEKMPFKGKTKGISLIKAYGLFDEAWYLHQYPDIARAIIDPLTHFVLFWFKEGRKSYPYYKQCRRNERLEGRQYELSIDILEQIEAAAQYESEVASVPEVGHHH
jgi:hypothetical protein